MRDDAGYLTDIIEAIEQIERYAVQGRIAYEQDELIQVWMVHHIQIIGEAVGKLSPELRSSYPEVPWSQISAMPNILVHDYLHIDLDEVWLVVQNDITAFKSRIETILRAIE